jgi:hypothetical protein
MTLSNCHALKNAFFSTLVKHHIIIETKHQSVVVVVVKQWWSLGDVVMRMWGTGAWGWGGVTGSSLLSGETGIQ